VSFSPDPLLRFLRLGTCALVSAGCLSLAPLPLLAQDSGDIRLHISLAPDSAPSGSRAPIVRSQNMLEENNRWLSALQSGLPVRLHYRVEVWRSRGAWFDSFERQAEWDVLIRHEPLLAQ